MSVTAEVLVEAIYGEVECLLSSVIECNRVVPKSTDQSYPQWLGNADGMVIADLTAQHSCAFIRSR